MSSDLLLGHNEAVAAWVAEQLDETGFGRCTAIGFLDRDGMLEAGVVYHNWNPEAGVIELSAASLHRRWTTRARVRVIFDYPLGFCQMVLARTSENNATAMRIWRAVGADFYRIPRLYGRDEAAFIMTLTAEQWLRSRFHG